MITTGTLGYEASTESIVALQQLLTALDRLPASWGSGTPVNAIMIGDDVDTPVFDGGYVLWPSTTWLDAESAWRDVSIAVDGGSPRAFALDAKTINEAKSRLTTLLEDYQRGTTPPELPVTPEPPVVQVTPPIIYQPAVTVPATAAVITPTKKIPSWAWWLLGIVGLGSIIALVAASANRRD